MNELNAKMFEDVVVFSFSEKGSRLEYEMIFYTKRCKYFRLNYTSKETPYKKICKMFPVLTECNWNVMEKKDKTDTSPNARAERVAPVGWKHIFLDSGYHLIVKEEYYELLNNILGKREKLNVMLFWPEIIYEYAFPCDVSEVEIEKFHCGDKVRFIARGLRDWTGTISRIDKNGSGIYENICPSMVIISDEGFVFTTVPIVWVEKI